MEPDRCEKEVHMSAEHALAEIEAHTNTLMEMVHALAEIEACTNTLMDMGAGMELPRRANEDRVLSEDICVTEMECVTLGATSANFEMYTQRSNDTRLAAQTEGQTVHVESCTVDELIEQQTDSQTLSEQSDKLRVRLLKKSLSNKVSEILELLSLNNEMHQMTKNLQDESDELSQCVSDLTFECSIWKALDGGWEEEDSGVALDKLYSDTEGSTSEEADSPVVEMQAPKAATEEEILTAQSVTLEEDGRRLFESEARCRVLEEKASNIMEQIQHLAAQVMSKQAEVGQMRSTNEGHAKEVRLLQERTTVRENLISELQEAKAKLQGQIMILSAENDTLKKDSQQLSRQQSEMQLKQEQAKSEEMKCSVESEKTTDEMGSLQTERFKTPHSGDLGEQHVQHTRRTNQGRNDLDERIDQLEEELKTLNDQNCLSEEMLRLIAANAELQSQKEVLKKQSVKDMSDLKEAQQQLHKWHMELIIMTTQAKFNFLASTGQVHDESPGSLREQADLLYATIDQMQATIDELQNQEQQLKQENGELKSDLTNSRNQLKGARKTLGANKDLVKKQNTKIEVLQSLNARVLENEDELQAWIDELKRSTISLEQENSELASDKVYLQSEIAEFETLIKELNEKLNIREQTIEELQERLDNRQEEKIFTSLAEELSAADMEEVEPTSEPDLDERHPQDSDITLQTDLQDLRDKLASVEAEEGKLKVENGQLKAQNTQQMVRLTEQNVFVDRLERTILDQDEEIVRLNTRMRELSSELQNNRGERNVSDSGSQTDSSELRAEEAEEAGYTIRGFLYSAAKVAVTTAAICGGVAFSGVALSYIVEKGCGIHSYF